MKNVTSLLLLTAFVPFVQSCGNLPAYFRPYEPAAVDTGSTDYRHARDSGDFTYHFFPEECLEAETHDATTGSSKKTDCRQKIPFRNQVQANDAVSINVLYAYICDFPEDARSWDELKRHYGKEEEKVKPCWNEESRAGVKGEVAVLATVFELDGNRKISWTQGSVADPDARVVYYSEDVREAGQPLNLSNLPMFGPITYHGKPVFLRFAAVELDQKETKETGTILRALASLGSKAYPPASPVLGALDKIGGAFLQSQQDDLFFEYTMMFNGVGGIAPVTAPLSAGILSFVRVQDRSKRFPWHKHCIDKTTGKIREKDGHKTCEITCEDQGSVQDFISVNECPDTLPELTGYTYFTIQITKNEPALSNDAFQKFSELNTLTEEDTAFAGAIGSYFTELEAEIEKTALFDRARSLAIDLYSPSQVSREKSRDAFKEALCLGLNESKDGFDAEKQLSVDKRYKLMEWLEQEWKKKQSEAEDELGASGFDASAFYAGSDYSPLCNNKDDSGWDSIMAALQ